MPNIKVSELTAVTSLAAADTFPVVQSGVTKKAAVSDISTLMLSSAPQTSFRNLLINGSFIVNQRSNPSYTITAGAALQYTVDRWYAYCTGANVTIGNAIGSDNKRRLQVTGAASNTGWGIAQRIEGATCIQTTGGNVTLSALILGAGSPSSVTWTAYTASTLDSFGTLASPTRTQIATGTFPVTSTTTRNTATFSTSSGNPSRGIEIVFSGGALSATQSVSFFDVQLEAGSVATQFEQRPMAIESQMCMRYLERNYKYGIPAGAGTTESIHEFYGCSNGSGNIGGYIKFAVPKRNTSYTATFYNPGGTSGSWAYLRSGVTATLVTFSATFASSEFGMTTISGNIGANWVVATIGGHWVVENEL